MLFSDNIFILVLKRNKNFAFYLFDVEPSLPTTNSSNLYFLKLDPPIIGQQPAWYLAK